MHWKQPFGPAVSRSVGTWLENLKVASSSPQKDHSWLDAEVKFPSVSFAVYMCDKY